MFDIISIGDATIDTFIFVKDVEVLEGGKLAAISWGDKLPVQEFYRTVAGNAANNAVGSARLGLETAFYAVLAHDTGGREIVHKMQKEGVSTRYIEQNDNHPTNNSIVLSHGGERTIFVYHEHRKYKLPNFIRSRWVYLTSMGEGFETVYRDLAKYVDRYEVKMGFNPGTFQLRAGPKANGPMLKRTELLSLNVEEAQGWVGDCSRDPEELCHKLLQLGPRSVVLTDGRRGAYSMSEEGFYYISSFPGPRIESTGAGDAFTTGYIAALVYGKGHAEALRWGPVNAGSVVQKVGPQEGLLSKMQMEQTLKKKKTFMPITITDESVKQKIINLANNGED